MMSDNCCNDLNEVKGDQTCYFSLCILLQLMSKKAPMVGPDITVRWFMPRFLELCTDALFHVRKVSLISSC